jgi:hypothetical protein
MDPATGSPGTPNVSAIANVEAVDAGSVKFTLNQPVVEFPAYITNRFVYIVRDGQPSEEIRTKANGTGPFKVQHFVPGEEPSVFVKNEAYWRPGIPKVDAVELRAIPEEAARLAAISAGQIDLVWDLPRVGLDELESNPDVSVVSIRSPFVMTISMWVDTIRRRSTTSPCARRSRWSSTARRCCRWCSASTASSATTIPSHPGSSTPSTSRSARATSRRPRRCSPRPATATA